MCGDAGGVKRVARDLLGKVCGFDSPPDHATRVVAVHAALVDSPTSINRAEVGRLRVLGNVCCLQIGVEVFICIVVSGNFMPFAALLMRRVPPLFSFGGI